MRACLRRTVSANGGLEMEDEGCDDDDDVVVVVVVVSRRFLA
jgi:hypothetical protein